MILLCMQYHAIHWLDFELDPVLACLSVSVMNDNVRFLIIPVIGSSI